MQVVAWGRRRGLARASCRFASCFAGFPGRSMSQSVTLIVVLLYIISSYHQHCHTPRGECRYPERERNPVVIRSLSDESIKAKNLRDESQLRLLGSLHARSLLADFFLPPRPVPAPHPPGFQPGVAHGTQLNASVARGDTITELAH